MLNREYLIKERDSKANLMYICKICILTLIIHQVTNRSLQIQLLWDSQNVIILICVFFFFSQLWSQVEVRLILFFLVCSYQGWKIQCKWNWYLHLNLILCRLNFKWNFFEIQNLSEEVRGSHLLSPNPLKFLWFACCKLSALKNFTRCPLHNHSKIYVETSCL